MTSGTNNTAMGLSAMYSLQTGSGNIAIGNQSLSQATSVNDNIVMGYNAIPFSSSGDRNQAIGTLSLNQNGTG